MITSLVTPTTDSKGNLVVVLSSSETFPITTNNAGQDVVITQSTHSIPLSNVNAAELRGVMRSLTFVSGRISTVVTPRADAAGQSAVVVGSNTIPLSDVLVADIGMSTPFTFVSGSMTEVVTPTTDADGQSIVIVTISTELPLESVTAGGFAASNKGFGTYIIPGQGGRGSSRTATTESSAAVSSTPGELSNSGNWVRDAIVDAWVAGSVALIIGLVVL